jgi:hypothetical protein
MTGMLTLLATLTMVTNIAIDFLVTTLTMLTKISKFRRLLWSRDGANLVRSMEFSYLDDSDLLKCQTTP